MHVTFSIPIDEIPDALDLEPELDGVDWIEDDPDLDAGPAHLYVHGSSTALVTIAVSESMALDISVPGTASPIDWELALAVVEAALETAETVLVSIDGGEPISIDELRTLCDKSWREEHAAAKVRDLRLRSGGDAVEIPGPVRTAYVGTRVLAEMAAEPADDVEQGRRLVAILRRVQWVTGPHDRATALHVPASDGATFTVAVVGPLLRYVLPPTDRLLVENGNLADDAGELLIPSEALDLLPGVQVTWLDDANRLMQPVAEADWPSVVSAAEEHRLPA